MQGSEFELLRPTGKTKTDGSHFWNVLLLFMLVKMQSKPFQKQDIVALNHQTLSTCHITGNLRELYRQTLLQ